MSQRDLFEPPARGAATAASRRDANMARATKGAGDVWRAAALRAIREVAQRRREFTADDVWEHLGKNIPGERRGLGPMLKLAEADGIVETTDKCRVSRRVERSGGTQRVWASRIYQGPPEPAAP